MRKANVVFFLITLGLLFSVSLVYAELAKEGSAEIRGAKSGTLETLPMGEGRLQMNWDETGVFIDAPEDCPLFHATWHAIGTLNGNKGKFVAIGGMVFNPQAILRPHRSGWDASCNRHFMGRNDSTC